MHLDDAGESTLLILAIHRTVAAPGDALTCDLHIPEDSPCARVAVALVQGAQAADSATAVTVNCAHRSVTLRFPETAELSSQGASWTLDVDIACGDPVKSTRRWQCPITVEHAAS